MKKAQRLLYEVVDSEVSDIESAELESYLKTDASLRAHFGVERRFRSMLKQKADAEFCPTALSERIVSALDAIDIAESTGEQFVPAHPTTIIPATAEPVSRFSLRYLLPMVASVALFLIGSFTTVHFLQHQKAYGAFEGAHFISRDLLKAGLLPEISADVTNFITKEFGVSLTEDLSGLSLCGGELIDLDKTRFAHFQFCGPSQGPVSIFVGSASDFSLPETPVTIIAGKEYFRHSCHGCNLMYWRSGDALIVAATAPDHMDVHKISDLVYGVDNSSSPNAPGKTE